MKIVLCNLDKNANVKLVEKIDVMGKGKRDENLGCIFC
jgi:hypothetical protein